MTVTMVTTTMPAAPPLQRRYSVSGKTLPEDVGAMKSPLQALDTSVQSTSCGLCECGGVVVGGDSVRTSSKRSATQIPSPNTPSSQELPTKIARLGLEHEHHEHEHDHQHQHQNSHQHEHDHGQDDMDFSSGEESCVTDPLPDEHSDWPEAHDTSMPSASQPGAWSEYDASSNPHTAILSPALSSHTEAASPLPYHAPTLTLLNLPPELRHQIYLHLPDLVLPYPLIYCLSTFANKKQHPLASVSTQVRSEALAIFYSYNTWIIKLEFRIMYDAFQDWIIRLGDSAQHLRIVNIAVRGRLFKPWTSHASSSALVNAILPHLVQVPGIAGGGGMGPGGPASQHVPMTTAMVPVESYSPPDGDASFQIDLSEKWTGGRVQVLRNDGTRESGEMARCHLQRLVQRLWEKRRVGQLNGQDWVDLVDQFLHFTGGGAW